MWFRLGIVPPVPLMLAHLYDISTTPTCNVNLNLPTSLPPPSPTPSSSTDLPTPDREQHIANGIRGLR